MWFVFHFFELGAGLLKLTPVLFIAMNFAFGPKFLVAREVKRSDRAIIVINVTFL